MPPYKRTLPGPPYVRFSPLTEGFQPGVGYIKNIFAHKPVWAACAIYMGISAAVLGYRYFKRPVEASDERLMYLEDYNVKRRADIADPTKPYYN